MPRNGSVEPYRPTKGSRRTDRASSRPQRKRHRFTADTADKYLLYQYAVQSPERDVAFLAGLYKRRRKKPALHLREDFSGTALLAANWVKRGSKAGSRYTAEGFDIDPEPVAWGMEHNVRPLGKKADRLCLHIADAREPSTQPPDVRVALNFSYYLFKHRSELLGYFRCAYEDLADDGLFVLDAYGGPEAFHEMEETRQIEQGFTYVWEQAEYWPVTGDYKTHIHFRFRDGSEMTRAFSYDWRLWTLPELQDVLAEAGFANIETYWEGTAANGKDGNGIYRRSRKGENCMAWVTYVLCWK